jgi:hypothetical protein
MQVIQGRLPALDEMGSVAAIETNRFVVRCSENEDVHDQTPSSTAESICPIEGLLMVDRGGNHADEDQAWRPFHLLL